MMGGRGDKETGEQGDLDTRDLVWVTCDICGQEYLEERFIYEADEELGDDHVCSGCQGELDVP
jgi:hypothetical protein